MAQEKEEEVKISRASMMVVVVACLHPTVRWEGRKQFEMRINKQLNIHVNLTNLIIH